MPDDPSDRSSISGWDREEPLFGPRTSTDEVRARPRPPSSDDPIEDAFSGPLFGSPSTQGRRTTSLGGYPSAAASAAGSPAGSPRVAGASSDGPDDHGSTDPTDGNDGDDVDADPGVWPRSEGKPPERRGGGAGSFFRELPVLLLIAFVLAFLLRTFVVQVFYIPSSSMEPTLQINDRMAVEKLTYQFREPRRGEVVVFEGEELGQVDPDANLGARVARGVGQFLGVVPASARDLVKRVVGLPGDEILIEDGQVFVNGTPIDEPYVVYPDGASYGPVTVPDDALFFLGDNRPNSSDSRRGLGFVPLDDVVGRAVVIIWPPPSMGSLGGVEYDLPDDG